MTVFLYLAAVIAFVGPIVAWAYLVALAGMYNTSGSSRGPGLGDFWDMEFLIVAAIPWLISVVCVYFARRMQ